METYSFGVISWLLIRRLIQIHKGKIIFCSDKNKKTSVILTFPIIFRKFSGVHSSLSVTSVFRNLSVSRKHQEEEISLVKNQVSSNLSEGTNREKHSILLVEENREFSSFLMQVLSEEYNVHAISKVESVCDVMYKERPDVVLLAEAFDVISGEKLCLQIKSDVKTAHVPVILFQDPVNVGNDSRRLADCCLALPLDISRLRVEINNLIFNRRIIRKRYITLVLGGKGETKSDLEEAFSDDEQNFLDKVRRLVEENLSNPDFNVDVLSAEMNMSRSGFYTRIKSITQQAPADYIRTLRLNKALILLMSKKYTVAEVADLTGFSDPKYFREVFKKYYGESPKKFVNSL